MRKWWRLTTHISWQLAALAAGVIVGAIAALWLPHYFGDGLWLLCAGLLCCIAISKRARWACLVACAAGMVIGAWRGTSEQVALSAYRPYYGSQLEVRGVLREDATLGLRGDMRFELSEVQVVGGPALPGRIWVSAAGRGDIKRGDRVQVRGRLGEGFGTLPGSMYRVTIVRIERPQPGDVARASRDYFSEAVRRGIPEPQASLGIGYLTGQRSTLPAELDEQLQTVGLTHAVVASGYNLTILVAFARNALAAVSKYLTTVAAALMIVLFILVTGFSPSMTRAGLVSALSLLSWYYGRVIHPMVLLPLVAALTILWRPAYAWGDIGWCLSFAAFAGVIILGPLLRHYLWSATEKPPMLLGLIVETIAAQAITLPIILYCFGQFSTYALVANLLVVPLVPIAMLTTFIAGLGGLLWPACAAIMAWPATLILKYMTGVVVRIASLPGASQEVGFNAGLLIGSYLLLVLAAILLWRATGHDFRTGGDKNV